MRRSDSEGEFGKGRREPVSGVGVDAEFHGRSRKLLVQGNRNGFFYVLDRITGELLMAEPFVKNLTWASGIGPDGRPLIDGLQALSPFLLRLAPGSGARKSCSGLLGCSQSIVVPR